MNDTREIVIGSKVKLVGSTMFPELNGTDGTVIEVNFETGMNMVELSTGQKVPIATGNLALTDEMVIFIFFKKQMCVNSLRMKKSCSKRENRTQTDLGKGFLQLSETSKWFVQN